MRGHMFVAHSRKMRPTFCSVVVLAALFAVLIPRSISAQSSELSLADILIALRSKKASMPEKNKILTDAVNTRGTTFVLTAEIERELANSGADVGLIGSLRKRAEAAARMPEPPNPIANVQNTVSPPAPDSAFYERRAEAASRDGDLDAALVEYGKAIEIDDRSISSLMGRAAVHFQKNAFLLAIADYSRVIALDEKNVNAFLNRAEAHEKNSSKTEAIADYRRAAEIDPTNIRASENIARLVPPPPPVVPDVKPPVQTVASAPVAVRPEFVELGRISDSLYVRKTVPVYPEIALRSRVSGQVTVAVEIDEEGEVTSAKATSGHAFLRSAAEFAAKRSRFQPAKFDGTPIRSRGILVYNFSTAN